MNMMILPPILPLIDLAACDYTAFDCAKDLSCWFVIQNTCVIVQYKIKHNLQMHSKYYLYVHYCDKFWFANNNNYYCYYY